MGAPPQIAPLHNRRYAAPGADSAESTASSALPELSPVARRLWPSGWSGDPSWFRRTRPLGVLDNWSGGHLRFCRVTCTPPGLALGEST